MQYAVQRTEQRLRRLGSNKMHPDTETISFLPMLEEEAHSGVWLFPNTEAHENDCGVYICDELKLATGTFGKAFVEVDICPMGDKVYYDFTYGIDNYGSGSPCDELSRWLHRNNTTENLRSMVLASFTYKIDMDGNIHERSKKNKLVWMMKKLLEEMT